ncbi:MAG TPA: hypothetical protein VFS34_16105 [Thermoanaerobaculia bacterium]|nr:hypothetical protein [Thermoanaerobaculia bacterium]
MFNRIFQALLVVCLATSSLWAADEPFVGKWKVNPSRSKLIDEMKVEAAGPDTFRLTFAGTGGESETIVANGTDQPGLSGTTFSVAVMGLNRWEVVRKMKGRTILRAEWTLSEDGKTLHDDFTQYLPDGMTLLSTPLPNGSRLFLPYVYERTAGSSGLVGTWDSESAKVSAKIELEIQRDERGGLAFKRSDEDAVKRIKFDGSDGRRVHERSLEITYRVKGTITGTRQIEISPDLKTLTMTDHDLYESQPKSILVFDRE